MNFLNSNKNGCNIRDTIRNFFRVDIKDLHIQSSFTISRNAQRNSKYKTETAAIIITGKRTFSKVVVNPLRESLDL